MASPALLRLAAAASVALVVPTVSVAAAEAAPAPHTVTATSAGYGGGYLARQLSAGAGHLESYGSVDVSDTAYAVLGLHAANVGRAQSKQAIAFLKGQLGAPLQGGDGTDDPGRLGYVIMAAVASGENPARFGGRKAVNDLTARLLATVRTSGPDTGLFGAADPTYDGAFRQGIALAAVEAAGVPAGTVQSSIDWLTHQQCANGLWEAYRANTSAACDQADPDTFTGPDTNSTGMAAQGLAAYGQHPRQSMLVSSLRAVRSSDDGYPYIAAPGQASDPDSTALSIQALLAEGADPGTAYAALQSYQLGCSAAAGDRGAYFYPGSTAVNLFATVQAVPAAAGKTLPLPHTNPSSALPAPNCTGAGGSSTAHQAVARAETGTPGACTKKKQGVTVTVDFSAFGGVEQTRCASGPQSSGVAALQGAGFTLAGTRQYGLAFICRINDLPSAAQDSCNSTPPASASWAYYHAAAKARTWTYSGQGASSYQPPLGSIEAWAFGNSAEPSKSPAQVRKAKA